MSLNLIAQIAVNGLLAGMTYVLMATGFTLIFGIMRLVNFAHGELYMVGAFVVYTLVSIFGVSFWVAVAAAVLVTALLGMVFERLLFRPLAGMELSSMIMALAIGIALQSTALFLFGPVELHVARPVDGVLRLGSVVIPLDRAVVGLFAVLVLAGFYVFMKKSRIGLAMQAVAQDGDTAVIMGISPTRVRSIAFAIAAGLAALAGALMAPIYVIGPYMGELPMLKAFIVVILGGLGSIPGAAIGGVLLGLVESLFSTLYSPTIAMILSFACLAVFLIWRPRGIMGKA